jgi:hypothetical protein
MLFLAVFCGFLAENWREYYVERHRENEYVAHLLIDLKRDTAYFNLVARVMEKQLKTFDSSNIALDQIPSLKDAEFIRLVLPLRTTYPITTTTTTFTQMKNSGSLRYIKDFELSSKLSRYYDGVVPQLLAFFKNMDDYYLSNIDPFIVQHFDLSESDFNTDTLKTNNPTYLERTNKSDFILKNLLIKYYNSLNFNYSETLADANHYASNLIDLIQKEYHLK